MMKSWLTTFCLFSFGASASETQQIEPSLLWGDLDGYETLHLNQQLKFSSGRIIAEGTELKVNHVEGLPGLPVILAELELSECADPDAIEEMVLVTPNESSEERAVGVTLEPQCNVHVYIESKDYYSSSFLIP